jgi:hypothetical protein
MHLEDRRWKNNIKTDLRGIGCEDGRWSFCINRSEPLGSATSVRIHHYRNKYLQHMHKNPQKEKNLSALNLGLYKQ